jgi:hypothetical protein
MCNIDNIIKDFEKAQQDCAPMPNFFSEVWGNLNENDHTRILLAILRTEVSVNGLSQLLVDDFLKTSGINIGGEPIDREGIIFKM